MSRPRVLFYVQYLEGIGHVVRARRIAEALVGRGCHVALVLGGDPIPGFDVAGATLHQLAPLHAGPDSYSRLLTPDGGLADDAYKFARRDALLAIYAAERPDILMTEAYPMGRWAMDFELEPLLAHASSEPRRAMIVASLRDILQMPKKADKATKSIALFDRYYDWMLVHGDAALVRIEESFPPLADFLDRAHYTGIVAPEPPGRSINEGDETFDVIVSGGGGAIGYEVLAAAIAAKPDTRLAEGKWLALAGPRMPDEQFDRLRELAGDYGVDLERYRGGLTGLMARARLSIQRAGYNTVADLLTAGCRGVLVPDAAGGQMEQPLRAAKLAARGAVVVVDEERLAPQAMAEAVDRALASKPDAVALDLDGAAGAADALCALYRDYQLAQDAAEHS
ncbi:MAG: glycosyltransferase family protein [Hyphomicrobiaceae bacterium]